MTRLITAVALALIALPALAIDWICTASTSPTRVAIAAADLPEGTSSAAAMATVRRTTVRSRNRIDRTDLMQAYSGQPVLIGHTWLLAVMLPANHPATREAFADLNISAEAAERMATGNSLVDRGIRVVQTPEQLIEKLSMNPPAVGYVGFFTGARDVALCF